VVEHVEGSVEHDTHVLDGIPASGLLCQSQELTELGVELGDDRLWIGHQVLVGGNTQPDLSRAVADVQAVGHPTEARSPNLPLSVTEVRNPDVVRSRAVRPLP
jgi:hypothetical protein